MQMRTLQFDFAVGLIQEMFHALINARLGRENWEPFLNGAVIAEVGFEAVVRLFGGRISPLFDEQDNAEHGQHLYRFIPGQGPRGLRLSDARGLMVMWDWPERGVIDQYGDKHTINSYPTRLPRLDLAWRVQLEFFARIFTKAFWTNYNTDRTMLYPPKATGHFFKAGAGDREPCRPEDENDARIPDTHRKMRSNVHHAIIKR